MKQVPTANADQRGILRICNVPDEIPIGDALREADRIAFCHGDTTSSFSPATVAWDHIKPAPER